MVVQNEKYFSKDHKLRIRIALGWVGGRNNSLFRRSNSIAFDFNNTIVDYRLSSKRNFELVI